MRAVSVATVFVAILTVSAPVRADRWYGWKILPSDAVATTTILVGAQSENGTVTLAGAAIYVLVPPIVHHVEGEDRRALKSFGWRSGLPLLILTITGGSAISHGDQIRFDNVVLPTVATCVIVALVDAYLATSTDPADLDETSRALYLRFGGSF